jgi:hypothetical protein
MVEAPAVDLQADAARADPEDLVPALAGEQGLAVPGLECPVSVDIPGARAEGIGCRIAGRSLADQRGFTAARWRRSLFFEASPGRGGGQCDQDHHNRPDQIRHTDRDERR